MKTICLGLLLGFSAATLALAGASPSETHVSIAFVHPEKFTDASPNRLASDQERQGLLNELGRAMQRSAGATLRNGSQLEVRVTDLDLAGDLTEGRSAAFDGVRFLRDVYPPRMTVEYRLRDSRGKVIDQGVARLSDSNYLFGATADPDPLRFDKALFRDWVRTKFAGDRK